MEYSYTSLQSFQKQIEEYLIEIVMGDYRFIFDSSKKEIRSIYFKTYSKNKTNWNMKIRPSMDWMIDDFRKSLQTKGPIW